MTVMDDLAIVICTFHREVLLEKALASIASQTLPHGMTAKIIVVDNSSPDGTAATARAIAARQRSVRCIKRVGRHGLSSACVEGMMAASAPIVAIMDADGQHDEAILPRMLEAIDNGNDMAIATRYAQDGAVADGFSKTRALGSRMATAMSRYMLGRDVSDPMSGYFMLKRDLADRIAPEVSRDGFKILFDILSRVDAAIKVAEIPFSFRPRDHGESKLGALVAVQFVGLLVSRLSGGILPVQFVLFSLVGALGLVSFGEGRYFSRNRSGARYSRRSRPSCARIRISSRSAALCPLIRAAAISIPCSCSLSIWSRISAISGEQISVRPDRSKAGSWKQSDLPAPVGRTPITSWPPNIDLSAASCSGERNPSCLNSSLIASRIRGRHSSYSWSLMTSGNPSRIIRASRSVVKISGNDSRKSAFSSALIKPGRRLASR